ncbi:hypothetical protein [Scytonema sp. NUACC21]
MCWVSFLNPTYGYEIGDVLGFVPQPNLRGYEIGILRNVYATVMTSNTSEIRKIEENSILSRTKF